MAGDVPKRPSYAIEDDTPSAKRKQLDNQRRVFVSDGVRSEGIGDFGMIQLDERSDRISNLPQELVHCILECLSVHDAARTSVLSKEWRCKWGMKNNLVLDKLFFLQLTANKDKDTHQSAFSRAVEMIILAHAGPLLSLNLFIPPKLDQFTVSRWLDHFLNKKVKVLEIFFSEKNACEIPLFTCEGLVEFKLTTGTLTASPKLGSFDNLRRVALIDVSITADISFGSQLKELLLYGCTGIHNLGCQFTNSNNLTYFILYKSEQIEWQWFKCTKQLKFLGLALTTVNPNTRMPVDLIKLLGDTPSISHLYVNGYTVEVLGQPFYPTLKGVAPRIEILRLLGLQFKNVCQIYNSLSLIRCLPNLRVLMIELKPGTRSLDPTVGQRMEKPCWKDVLLHQLHTLTILDVVVDTRVLSLIKTLLAVSPSLKKIFFHFSNVKADAYAEMSKIKKLFRQCPRKSLSAKIYLSFQNPRNIVTQPNRYSSHLGALWFELH